MVKKETKKKEVKKAPKPKETETKVKKAGCEDINCPFHGKLKVRGRAFEGTVVKAKMKKTVTVGWSRRIYIPKYERYQVRKSKVIAHLPACIKVESGDRVKIAECRPLSKMKKFVVVKKYDERNKSKSE
ncbi:MAG: 30S ribosomal protein S17 [Candidatus Woesearchaeota archaeon]|nr:MAG: 30S ribosomal protein S17 [Candidatus Woesearchaeota archaeon]